MPQPVAIERSHAHVPHCTCDQCLNPSTEPVSQRRALCDDCRPHTTEIVVPRMRALLLRCEACDAMGEQGKGIEALADLSRTEGAG